jgi:uncharacterized protein (DUF1697 family)
MSNYIVLLRGINVGGHNKLPMSDLRSLLTDNGYKAVSTYIQSGNILLSSDKDSKTINTHICGLLKNTYDYNIPVITISVTALQQCFNDNPFLNTETDIKFLHVTFLDNTPKKESVENFNVNLYNNDRFQIVGQFVYLHTPDGFAKTKFSNTQFEKQLNTTATTRNWRTVTKLIELSENNL